MPLTGLFELLRTSSEVGVDGQRDRDGTYANITDVNDEKANITVTDSGGESRCVTISAVHPSQSCLSPMATLWEYREDQTLNKVFGICKAR